MSRSVKLVAGAAMVIAWGSCAAAASAPAGLDQLGWLAGCWNSENAEPGSGEQWMPLAGGSYLGMSRTVRDGKTVAFEFMRIGTTAEGAVAFFAQPSGQPPTPFTAVSQGATEVVFENPALEFPRRVIYRLESATRMHARIEGQRQGVSRGIDFPMLRVSCDALLPAAR